MALDLSDFVDAPPTSPNVVKSPPSTSLDSMDDFADEAPLTPEAATAFNAAQPAFSASTSYLNATGQASALQAEKVQKAADAARLAQDVTTGPGGYLGTIARTPELKEDNFQARDFLKNDFGKTPEEAATQEPLGWLTKKHLEMSGGRLPTWTESATQPIIPIPHTDFVGGGSGYQEALNSAPEAVKPYVRAIHSAANIPENLAEDFLNYAQSPAGIATAGFGSLGRQARAILGYAFAGQALKEAPGLLDEWKEADTPEKKVDVIRHAIGLVAMGSGAIHEGMRPSKGGAIPEGGKLRPPGAPEGQVNLSALAPPEGPQIPVPKPEGHPEILDGLHVARAKEVEQLQRVSSEQRPVVQQRIDDIDEILLAHDRNAVSESAQRTTLPPARTPPPASSANIEPGGSPSDQSNLFRQLQQRQVVAPIIDATEQLKAAGAEKTAAAAEQIAQTIAQKGHVDVVQPVETQPALEPAIKTPSGDVMTGEDHVAAYEKAKETTPDTSGSKEGFVDAQGNFISREEAAKQTELPTQTEEGKLHSSDLPEEKPPDASVIASEAKKWRQENQMKKAVDRAAAKFPDSSHQLPVGSKVSASKEYPNQDGTGIEILGPPVEGANKYITYPVKWGGGRSGDLAAEHINGIESLPKSNETTKTVETPPTEPPSESPEQAPAQSGVEAPPGAGVVVSPEAYEGHLKDIEDSLSDEEPTVDVTPKEKKTRSFSVKRSAADPHFANDPLISAVMDDGLMSKPTARKKMGAEKWETNKGEWDDAPDKLASPSHNSIYKEDGMTPDEKVMDLIDRGLLPPGSQVSDMWREIKNRSESAKRVRQQESAQTREIKGKETQAKGFQKEAAKPIGDLLNISELKEGDSVKVGDETMKVLHVDEDGSVTLEDGKKFGIQQVGEGDIIYGELTPSEEAAPFFLDPKEIDSASDESNVTNEQEAEAHAKQHGLVETETKPTETVSDQDARGRESDEQGQGGAGKTGETLPRLKPGQREAELLQGDNEPFNLVSETAADKKVRLAMEAKEQADKAAKDAAEAKRLQDEQQQGLFEQPEKPSSPSEVISALQKELDQAVAEKRTRDTTRLRRRIKELKAEAEEVPKDDETISVEPTPPETAKGTIPVFTRNEVEVSKPQVSRRKRGDAGTDGESVTTVEAPSKVTSPENWHRLGDIKKLSAHVESRIDFETGKAPKKSDPVWSAYSGRRTQSSREAIVKNVTYYEAIEAAKSHIESANPSAEAAAPVEPPSKTEPWHKTREEIGEEGGSLAAHRLAVRSAVKAGEQVPLNVLESYSGSEWADAARKKMYGEEVSDGWINKILDKLKNEDGTTYADPLFIQSVGKPALRAAVKLIREGIEAGKLVGDAVTDAVNYLKSVNPKVDEDKVRDFFLGPHKESPAATPREAGTVGAEPTPEATPDTTALKRAVVDTEAKAAGRAEIPTETRPKDEQIVADAKARTDADPTLAKTLVSQIVDDGKTGITESDAATLLVERRRLRNERQKWEVIAGDDQASSTQKGQAKTELQRIESEQTRLDQAGRAAGREWSDVGRMYQREIAADYSLEALETKQRAVKGGPLSEKERATVKKRAAEYEKAQKTAEEAQAKADSAEEKEAVTNIINEGKKQAKKPSVLKIASETVDRWKAEADEARKSLKGFFGSETGAVGDVGGEGRRKLGDYKKPEQNAIKALAKVIRAHVAEVGLDFAEVSARVLKEFGDKAKPYLDTAWDTAKGLVKGEKGIPKEEPKAAGAKTPKTVAQTKARLKADVAAGDALDPKMLSDLVRAHVREGFTGEDEVMAAVHKDVQEAYPDATEKDVRRGLVKYGSEVKAPTRDAVETRVRQLKSLVKVQEDIRNLQEGEPTWKSQIRDKRTQELRDKVKIRTNLLKQLNLPESEDALASRSQARATALENRIKDIDRELATGQLPPDNAPVTRTPREEDLMMQRDALQEKLNEVRAEARPKPTEADIAAEKAQQGVDRAAASLDRQQRINSGELKPEKGEKVQPLSELEKELRDRTEELRKAKRESDKYRSPEDIEADKAQKGVDAAAAALDKWDRYLKGETSIATGKTHKEALSNLEEEMRAQVDAMKQAHREMQTEARKGDPGNAEQKSKLKALEKSISDYEKKAADLRAGIERPKLGKKQWPDTEVVTKAQAARDAAKKVVDDLEKAKNPPKSTEERYNETRIKQVQKMIAEGQDRLARRDYSPKSKAVPLAKTAEVAKAEADLRKIRQDIQNDIGKIAYEKRGAAGKAIESLNKLVTGLKVVGHGTVGMITHAGGLLYRPEISTQKIWWQNFFRQFKMWDPIGGNPEYHEQLIHRMTSDPEFNDWKEAGASIDPEKNYTDYGLYVDALKHLSEKGGKPGKMVANFLEGGQRGFDALKLARLELNKAAWEKVSPEIKADPAQAKEMRRYIAEMNNKATGAIPAKVNPVGRSIEESFYNTAKQPLADVAMFAPRLYASRWGRIVVDPIKTVGTFSNWKNATPAERAIAAKRVGNAAKFAAGLTAALATNQAILSATGSQQKVNMTDPTKPDWLKFKAFGKEVVADGGLLDPVRLLGQIVIGDIIQDKMIRGESGYGKIISDLGKYYRGKMNPALGLVADEVTGRDYGGRPLPQGKTALGFGKEVPETSKKPKYTWGEWLWSQGPIPLSGGAKVAYDQMRKEGMSHIDAMKLLKGAAVSVLGLTGAHISDDHTEDAEAPPAPSSKRFTIRRKRVAR